MELSGFLISWEIVELIRLRSSPSAFDVSYMIFDDISKKHIIYLSGKLFPCLIKLLLTWKNLNPGTYSSSIPLNIGRFWMIKFKFWEPASTTLVMSFVTFFSKVKIFVESSWVFNAMMSLREYSSFCWDVVELGFEYSDEVAFFLFYFPLPRFLPFFEESSAFSNK